MKNIKKLAIFALIGIFIIPYAVFAHMGNADQNVSQNIESQLQEAVQKILKDQNIKDKVDIDCGKVSDDSFEELGEVVMSLMHPDEEEHTAMDNMMGGEGSDTLRQMHINMGRSYLGCFDGRYIPSMGMMMGMMGVRGGMGFDGRAGMMDEDMMNGDMMEDREGSSYVGDTVYRNPFGMRSAVLMPLWGWIVMVVAGIAFVFLIVWVVNGFSGGRSGSPLDILKERYVKGEINRDEYERMKKEIMD